MSLFRSMDISATGLMAGRTRLDVIAQNIANVESTDETGQPYRRKEVVLVASPWRQNHGLSPAPQRATGGVRVLAIREDTSPAMMAYRPDDPAADERGYVHLPNVNLPLEMVDMVAASRAYEANAAALRTGREMVKRTLDILR